MLRDFAALAYGTRVSRRDNADLRCEHCHMHTPLCICAELPRLTTRSRLILLLHYREARKPTNTGSLAAACLSGTTTFELGEGTAAHHAQPRPDFGQLIQPHEQAVLLFPADDAVPIDEWVATVQPVAPVLIVPDGNWRQASKMRGRLPGLAALPCVTLPTAAATAYRLRAEPKSGGLATLEAIAHALLHLEQAHGQAVAGELLRVFQLMVERTLWLRGSLAADKVAGGIPPAALAFYRDRALDRS